jgi:hypothetical protein
MITEQNSTETNGALEQCLQDIDDKTGCQKNQELHRDLCQEKNSHFAKCLHYPRSSTLPQPSLP